MRKRPDPARIRALSKKGAPRPPTSATLLGLLLQLAIPCGTRSWSCSRPRQGCGRRDREPTWDMVVDATGQLSGLIELTDGAAKKCSGRSIPIHPDLAAALAAWRQVAPPSEYMIASERGGRMRPLEHRRVVQPGIQEHSPEGLLVALRPQNVRHQGRSGRPQSRRLAAGRAIAGGPPVDPDDAAVHRRRHRCPA